MSRKQIINAVLAVVFFVLTLAMPVRSLMSGPPSPTSVTFDSSSYEQGFMTSSYILLALLGALTLAFAWKAWRGSDA